MGRPTGSRSEPVLLPDEACKNGHVGFVKLYEHNERTSDGSFRRTRVCLKCAVERQKKLAKGEVEPKIRLQPEKHIRQNIAQKVAVLSVQNLSAAEIARQAGTTSHIVKRVISHDIPNSDELRSIQAAARAELTPKLIDLGRQAIEAASKGLEGYEIYAGNDPAGNPRTMKVACPPDKAAKVIDTAIKFGMGKEPEAPKLVETTTTTTAFNWTPELIAQVNAMARALAAPAKEPRTIDARATKEAP